ncbi:uncharacterized protein LOC144454158 [Phascolarctos cinereus]
MHSVPPGTGMFLAGHILQRCTQPAPKSLHVLCTVRALAMDGAGLSLSGARPNASGQTPALCEPPARSAPAACPAPSRPEAAGRELEPAGPARRCQSLLALPRTPLASAADPSGGAKKPCLWGSESPNLPLKRPAQSAICWPSLLPRKSILVGAPGLRTPGDIPNPDLMDAYRKENVPPWPGDHLQSGQRLVQKNVSISLSVGDGRDTKTASFQTQSKRTVPTILPGLGPGRRLEVGRPVVSRQLPALVQTNLAPAGQPLQDATSLVSNSGFEQQSNLQPRAWRPGASGPWRGFSFQQSNMKLSRADPERRGGHRRPQTLEGPDRNLAACLREPLWPLRSERAPWPGRPKSQSHGYPFLREEPSSSSPGLGNTVRVSPKVTKAQGSELSPPPWSGHQDCLAQPGPRLRSTSGCWAPNPVKRPLTLEDLGLSGQCQRPAHPLVLGPRAKFSPESACLLLSRRHLEWPMELFRASQEQPRTWPHSNRATSPEASPALTPGQPNPLTYPCRAVPPETPHLIPGHPSPLTYHCSAVSPVISPDLTPRHPSPLTHPCRAVPPETPHQTPGHPSPLTLSHSNVSPVISLDLTPRHPSPLTVSHSTVSPAISPDLTSGHPSLLTVSHSTVSPVISLDLTPRHPSPLTVSHSTMSPVISPDLTSGHPSPLTVSHSTMSPVISPGLPSRHPSPLTLSHSTVSPEAPPNLTLGYPCPHTLSDKTTTAKASPKLTPGYSSLHPCSSKIKVPEASTNLMPEYPSALTLSHRM